MIIRCETPGDYDAIRALHVAAFAEHPFSHQTEHLIVDALRASGALTVSLVAEVDGEVAGHVAFSPVKIGGADCRWLALGPVAVVRRLQRRGIGRRLIDEGLEAVRRLGAGGCVLVGDPAYYGRFGFRHDPELTLHGVPRQFLLYLPFAGQTPRGEVVHDPAFSVGH